MKKIFSYGMIGAPIVSSVVGVGIYYAVKTEETEPIKNVKTPTQEESIFPNITFDELYDDIKIKGNQATIPDDMIAKFIKIILMRIGTKESIKVKVFRDTEFHVEIQFSTKDDEGEEVSKIYSMELKY